MDKKLCYLYHLREYSEENIAKFPPTKEPNGDRRRNCLPECTSYRHQADAFHNRIEFYDNIAYQPYRNGVKKH